MLTKTLTTPESVYNPENENPAYAGFSRMGGAGLEPAPSWV
jgi:hypothetical protein